MDLYSSNVKIDNGHDTFVVTAKTTEFDDAGIEVVLESRGTFSVTLYLTEEDARAFASALDNAAQVLSGHVAAVAS